MGDALARASAPDPRTAARRHALADVAADAARRAEAAREAMARLPETDPEREYLRARWDALCRIADRLRAEGERG